MQSVYPLALVALGSWLLFLTGAAFLCEALQCLHVPTMGVCIYVPMQHCLYMCLLAWFMAVCCFFGILFSKNLSQPRKYQPTLQTPKCMAHTHTFFQGNAPSSHLKACRTKPLKASRKSQGRLTTHNHYEACCTKGSAGLWHKSRWRLAIQKPWKLATQSQ